MGPGMNKLRAFSTDSDAEDGCSVDERAQFIDGTHWAQEFSWREIKTIAEYVRVFSAEKRTVILREGAVQSFLCLLASGNVEIVKLDSADKSKVIGSVDEGKTFGEMALIDRGPRSASVVAVSDTILIVLHLAEFNNMSDSSPRLALKILHRIAKLLSHRLRQTSGVLADFLDD